MDDIMHVALKRRDYDLYCIAHLEAELAVIDRSAVIDLAAVRYFDSTSIGALVRRLKHVRQRKAAATFTLKNVSPSLVRVFEIVQLDRVFTILP